VRALFVGAGREEAVARVRATMAPPNTTLPIKRWMLIGIQVWLRIACQILMLAGAVCGVMSRGGVIM